MADRGGDVGRLRREYFWQDDAISALERGPCCDHLVFNIPLTFLLLEPLCGL